FMAARSEIVDYVRHTSRPFIFSASIPPAMAAAALAALHVIEREPERVERLAALSRYMRAGLSARGVAVKDNGGADTPIVPFYTYDLIPTLTAAKKLYEAGVYVNPVLPPAAPEGECLLRTSLMATHTEALLDEAMDIIRDVLREP
ncbi:MAG: aminotransferase class I/II-fold pyridoxal phosphate-dependent enzyme, partial [Eubacteriales bacterium]